MIPQDHFIVVAEVDQGQVAPLRALLATMTLPGFPCMADPHNALLRTARTSGQAVLISGVTVLINRRPVSNRTLSYAVTEASARTR